MAARHALGHRPSLAAFVIISLLGLSACSGGGGEGDTDASPSKPGPPAAAPTKPIAVRYSAWGRQGKIELMALERVAGRAVVAHFRLANETGEEYPVGTSLRASMDRKRAHPKAIDLDSISGVSLLDKKNSRQHFPLNREDGQCLCSRFHPALQPVRQGRSYELRAAFPAPPADVKSMGVMFPHAPPFLDIPLKDVPGQSYLFDEPQGRLDPSAVKTAPPLVLPVIGTVERGENGEDDDGRNINVRLSTDVLFATNKSDLNATAQGRLRAVAGQIDKSKGATVRVDGHTDNTGNDAINDPLSQRRAEAVRGALQGLVTRAGVTFQARGHGSKQPVASNNNNGGRQKNRRVTVSFERPVPPAPANPSGGQGQPPIETWPRPVLARTAPDPGSEPLGGWPKDLSVEINTLARDATGFATLVFTVVNPDGSVMYDTNNLADADSGLYLGESTTGVSLVSGDRRVLTLRTDDNRPVGNPDFGSFLGNRFDVTPEGRLTLWSTFKIPSDIADVDIQIQGFKPARDVPIK